MFPCFSGSDRSSRGFVTCEICGEECRPHLGTGLCDRCYRGEYDDSYLDTAAYDFRVCDDDYMDD